MSSPSEVVDVAQACAAAYVRMVDFYRQVGYDSVRADALARQPGTGVEHTPSHEMEWAMLNGLLEQDPSAAQAIWTQVKQDAAQYVDGGYHVSDALCYTTPWQRAQFAVLRQELYADWQPVGAVERALLDTYAAAFLSYVSWLGKIHSREVSPPPRRPGNVSPQTSPEVLDQAAAMADRFHRQMIRALRAMRDLRRFGAVVIHNPGQVNIAGQQLNATRIEERHR